MADSKRWFIPLLIGLALPLVSFLTWRHFTAVNAHLVKQAHVLGVDPNDLQFVWGLNGKEEISGSDWTRLRTLTQNQNPEISFQALAAVGGLEHSQYRVEAIQTARPLLHATDSDRRNMATIALWRLGAPDWREVAQEMQNDPDSQVRATAIEVMKRKAKRPGNGGS
ncbi:MAG: hypothetical protein JWL77_3222 [Chthonomonadaceae bacterium]|nr:hypothetical protein [Chthonomonadaceae bacterium]